MCGLIKRKDRPFLSPPQKGASLIPHCSFADDVFSRFSLAKDAFRVVFSYILRGSVWFNFGTKRHICTILLIRV